MPLCEQCGTGNPDEARFCLACGTPLAARAQPAREIRKTVTIVFSDLTGSTRLGESLDSESLRLVMSRYFETMSSVLDRHGGTIEKFIGDAVMAVFGVPTVREDDALRAVRAAGEMRDALNQLNAQFEARWGVGLRARIGVNTGEVVAGDSTTGGQFFATGDAVNVAARLEQAAGADEILIGEQTYQLVRDAVRVEPVEPLALKGKSRPVPAFRLIEVVPDAPGVARRLDSPIVGRERELALLEATFETTASDHSCRLVAILGPAGGGKSRLVHELAVTLGDRAGVLRGRCLPYGEGITFWPLAEIVRRAADITDTDSPERAREKIATLVPADEDAATVVERVSGAVGLSDATPAPEETFWAVRKLLAALSAECPLVVVFDDLHWAEDILLDLIAYLAQSGPGLPVLLLALGRPELVEAQPGRFTAATSATIRLEPLSGDLSRLLIDNLLDHSLVAEGLSERIANAAGGNPLFLEELVRMLADEGVLERTDDRWTQTRELSDVAVPPTIHALLAARLERLLPAERGVVERASVIGQGFWRAAVHALSPEEDAAELDDHLYTLTRKELVRAGGPRFAGEDGLCFSHLLVRDVAYGALLKESRADFHERFAGWIEHAAGDRVTEYEEILGYHLEQSHRYRTELGPADERVLALAARAADRLGQSGRRALARGDMPAAVRLLERAVALLPDDAPARTDLSLKLGIALAETGDVARADSLLNERLELERRDRSFLAYRDGTGRQRLFDLASADARVMIGRREDNDVALSWDGEVSRLHAALERGDDRWELVDEGVARNGSFLNGRRVTGRHELRDGDVLRFGDTIVLYRMPTRAEPAVEAQPGSGVTVMGSAPLLDMELSETERRVLAALSKHVTVDSGADTMSTNERIAQDLSMGAGDVEAIVSTLFRKFHTSHLPEGQQHDSLVERASQSGVFERPSGPPD